MCKCIDACMHVCMYIFVFMYTYDLPKGEAFCLSCVTLSIRVLAVCKCVEACMHIFVFALQTAMHSVFSAVILGF